MPKAKMRSVRRWLRSIEKDSVDEIVLHMVGPSCIWPYESSGAACALSRWCLVEGTMTTPAGSNPGLAPQSQLQRSKYVWCHNRKPTAKLEQETLSTMYHLLTMMLCLESGRHSQTEIRRWVYGGCCSSIDLSVRESGRSANGDVWTLCGLQCQVIVGSPFEWSLQVLIDLFLLKACCYQLNIVDKL